MPTPVSSDSSKIDINTLKAPSALLMLLEGRAPWELAALFAASPVLRKLPQGDGHPVLVFPGLSAPDFTTLPLRNFIRDRGYTPYTWDQGFNLGPREGVLDNCRARAEAIYALHKQPVSLVGWSLGGLYAREVAKLVPEQTRCVITLGSPFSGHARANNAWWLYQMLSGQNLDDPSVLDEIRKPPPGIPTTSIYSRTDGIVSWRCSVNEKSPLTENIEVHSSHIGMGVNPLALYAVADRLRQEPGKWRPFEREGRRTWFFKTP
jgi:pimeloyl-ACP methyl ester carboxylesterase